MKIRFRTLTSLLLAFLLFAGLLAGPLFPASAEQPARTNLFGSALMDSQSGIRSAALVGDTLYIQTYTEIYSYAPGDSAPVLRLSIPEPSYGYGVQVPGKEPEPMVSTLLSDGNTLYTIATELQTLYTLTIEGDQLVYSKPLKLEMDSFVDGEPPYTYVRNPALAFFHEGRLYIRMDNYEGRPVDLFSFDLETGKIKEHPANHLVRVTPYKDGKLIAARLDYTDMYDMETGTMRQPELAIYNPKDDSLEMTGVFLPIANGNPDSLGALYYDAAEDSLYTYTDTDLLRLDGDFKTSRLIGYLPMFGNYGSMVQGGLLPLPDGRLAVTFYNNTFLRERTEKGLEGFTVLTFAGGLDDPNTMQRVMMELDNVVLRRVEGLDYNYLDAERLASMFLTGNVPVDLMPMNAYGFDMDKLIQKGYLADLSSSPAVMDFVSRLHPNLSRAFVRDGKVFAVPASLMLSPLFAYELPFKELGLEIPTSMKDLLALARQWSEGLGEEHSEYRLLNNEYDYKQAFTRIVIDNYMDAAFGEGKDLSFDTLLFRALMQEVDSIDFTDMTVEINWDTPEGQAMGEEFWNKRGLIETGMGYEPQFALSGNNFGDYTSIPMIIPPEEGMDGYHSIDFTMLTVLSTSKNKDTAIRVVAEYLNKLDKLFKLALDPSQTEPLINPDYEKQLKTMEKQLADMKALLEHAEGAARSNLEESIRYTEEYYEQYKATGQYLTTKESLAALHAVMAKTYVMNGLMNAQRMALYDEASLIMQYADGAITLDQFIRQADEKLRLVRMEYQ